MKNLIYFSFALAFAFAMNSCSKNDSQTYPYQVRMTDAPGPYDSVNIDLIGVEVTGPNGAVNLNVTAGMYNLLDLSNGINKIIATSVLKDSRVNQIRLILGTNNTVVLNGVSYPLSTPSADQSGLKLLVDQTLQADIQNQILLDFDANTSIVLTGSNTYKLKPVIRTIVTAVSGTIKGAITPVGTKAVVTATAADNTIYSSSVNSAGQFQIAGLAPGVYTFTVTPESPYLPVTQTAVAVTAGVTVNLGTIAL